MNKYDAELAFWKRCWADWVRWYNGGYKSGELYGIPQPTEAQKVKRFDTIERNALETWVIGERWRYCKHLLVEPTYFSGQKVLEIGAGPLGLFRWFVGANVDVVEPLAMEYWKAGYPAQYLSLFTATKDAQIVLSTAECIAATTNTYDAAFSVNAIDHVDDFEKAISEIERVVRPDGEIRIECHYHRATETEPIELTDERVRAAFKKFDVQPISRLKSTAWYPPGTHPADDTFVLWSNVPYKWGAIGALR